MSISAANRTTALTRATQALVLAVSEYYRHAVTIRSEVTTDADTDLVFDTLARIGDAVFPLEKAAHLGRCDADNVTRWVDDLVTATREVNLPAGCPSTAAVRACVASLRLAGERFASEVRDTQQRTGVAVVECR